MALWLAICITLLATTGNSIGKALQKHGTKGLPKFSFDSKVVWSYLRCTEWVVGILADLLGGVLMISAYALAPVCSIVLRVHSSHHLSPRSPSCSPCLAWASCPWPCFHIFTSRFVSVCTAWIPHNITGTTGVVGVGSSCAGRCRHAVFRRG